MDTRNRWRRSITTNFIHRWVFPFNMFLIYISSQISYGVPFVLGRLVILRFEVEIEGYLETDLLETTSIDIAKNYCRIMPVRDMYADDLRNQTTETETLRAMEDANHRRFAFSRAQTSVLEFFGRSMSGSDNVLFRDPSWRIICEKQCQIRLSA
jgi:hypothetical protein